MVMVPKEYRSKRTSLRVDRFLGHRQRGSVLGVAHAPRGVRCVLMTDVNALDLPVFDPADVTLSGDRFHEVMATLAEKSWLARIPLGYMTLDREAGEFFLRTKQATFPGQKIAELFGIDSGSLREEIDRNILHVDGDAHGRLRNLVNPAFTPRAADR